MGKTTDIMQGFAIKQAIKYLEKDPEKNMMKVLDMVDAASPEGWYGPAREKVRKSLETKDNWYQLILKVLELDPGVRNAFLENFIFNSALRGSAVLNESREREGCNVPWAILLALHLHVI